MAQFGKEGRDLIRRLYEGLDIDAIESKNTKKQIRRALGALIFSSDSAGYLDIVENGLTEGLDPVKILGRIRTASERLIESYSPVKGVYEAHHGNPLSALREAYLALSPEEQDRFMDRIEASGWKLGDDPEQLTNTVFTRMSHQRKVPEVKKGDPSGLKSKFQGLKLPPKGLDAHPRGTRDTFLTVKPGEFTTGDALADHFEQVLAPRAMEDLGNAMVQDTPSRLIAAQQGLDVTEVTPENNRALLASEQGALAVRRGTEAIAENYQPTNRSVREILESAGQDPDVLFTRPTAIKDIGKIITPSLTGFSLEDIQRIAKRTLQITEPSVYSVDPIGAALSQGSKLIKEQGPTSLVVGSVADPQVGGQVARGEYKEAATTVAKNTLTSAIAGAGIQRAVPPLTQFISQRIGLNGLAGGLARFAGFANPLGLAVGGALTIKSGLDTIEEYQAVGEGYENRFERQKDTRKEIMEQYQQQFGTGSISDRAFEARDRLNNN